jgi:ligand-binding sensor domain-containing protein
LKFKKYIVVAILLLHKVIVAQYPQYFIYNDENGLPSNEIYSIVQDNKGFVWFGCDAGLYKYDGIRYIPYKCQKQKAKSITGLTVSSSGKLFCYNFQSQVFMLQNDTLIEISNLFPSKITSITSNKNGEIFISHSGGISIYNEQKNNWTKFGTNNNELAITNNNYVTKNSKHHPNDTVFFFRIEWNCPIFERKERTI